MKKLFFLVLTVGALATAKAQITYGVKAGANLLSNLRVSPKTDLYSFSSKVDFHGGAFVGIPLFDKFSLQPEVLYSGEGSKVKYDDGETKAEGKYNLSYINVPVLFKYNDASGFFAETGPQIGFLLSAKAKADGESQDIKDAFKSTNFSWGLGAGYLSSIGLGVDLRYNLGLSNIAEGTEGQGSIKTGTLQLGVFYQLGGKK